MRITTRLALLPNVVSKNFFPELHPLTKAHKVTGIFRKLGPERPEVTPGGDRCKTSGAYGPGAEMVEPGNPRLGVARRWESSYTKAVANTVGLRMLAYICLNLPHS